MAAGSLWNTLFQGNQANIRKGLYGSVLCRDYNQASTSLTSFTPFNASDGNLVTGLFGSTNPGGPWVDLGYLDEGGPEFDPKLTTELTKVMQTRRPARADYTEDSEEITFTLMESNGATDALTQNKSLGTITGSAGLLPIGATNYAIGRPVELDIVYRQLLFIGVDNTSANAYYMVRAYPRVVLTSIGRRSWNAKKPDSVQVKFQSFDDPYTVANDGTVGAPLLLFRDGPAWRTQGQPTTWPVPQTAPVATAVTGKQATIVFAAPLGTSPFTYAAYQTTGGVQELAQFISASGTTSITVTVGGLTVGSNYTFNVVATGANGTPTVQSLTSNSITAIA